MKLSRARKEISRTENDGKETIVNEIIRFKMPPEIMEGLKDIFDDYEYGQENGVYSDLDGFVTIDVDECVNALLERKDYAEETYFIEDLLIEFFKKYAGFTIWV